MCTHIQEFELYLKQNKSASNNTVVSYMRDVNKFNEFSYLNGIKNIVKCSDKDIAKYISHLQDEGKSAATTTRVIASLRAFYTYLMSIKVVSKNPTKNIKFEKKKTALPRILTSSEVDLFLSQPKCDSLKGYRDKAMLELLYATGIRVSELIELDVIDLNCELGFVRCGKGSGERVIPLYPAAVSAAKEYISKARPLLLASPAEKALFVNLNGGRMTRQGFWKVVKHYQEAANIQTEITPHVLRHSFAAHLLQNGADISVIKEMMGHSDISSTLVYAKLIQSNLKNSYIQFHPRAQNI